MKLADLFDQIRKLEIMFGDKSLTIEYRVDCYTPELEAMLVSADQRPADVMARVIPILVSGWTLETDTGQPYPLTYEACRKLPVMFMVRVFQEIAADMSPKAPSAEA